MRFLCLHGRGTSAAIFESQTASFRYKLDASRFTFDFIDAPYPSTAAAGVELFYSGPYYSFWPGSDIEDIKASQTWLLQHIAKHGPYDGVMTFSQGCSVIGSFLLYHAAERPKEPLPFKVAIFICGGMPLPVLEDLGIYVGAEAREWDELSKWELHEKASATVRKEPGFDRWGSSKFDSEAAIDRSNVFGINFKSGVPEELRINIPTVHIYGCRDPRFPSSRQLEHFCEDGAKRKSYDHSGGHDIPRSSEVSERIAGLVEWCAGVVGMGEKAEVRV
jgi:hypothetical protein